MRICTVVGARPQFIKAAVVSRELAAAGIEEDLVHTGQHYDSSMSRVFFDELYVPAPAVDLGVGSASHAIQTGLIMTRLEQHLSDAGHYRLLLVYGDTNSTLAATLVASKMQLPVGHVEAGLRSGNLRMPEEINRIVTDRLSSLLFCPSELAVENLAAEGLTEGVSITGDVMRDALEQFIDVAKARFDISRMIDHEADRYYLATVHRAETADDPDRLRSVVDLLASLDLPVVWPVHPRASKRLKEFNLTVPGSINLLPPLGYLEMLSLLSGTKAVLTDSGGLQKEAFWLRKPCITLRSETEWVETTRGGWNTVTDIDPDRVRTALAQRPTGEQGAPYGRGDAGKEIASILTGWQGKGSRR
ncbi:MAG: UDP-N-acetylglucosamine 2-epimerase (non-hydrolyzing) [Rhodothermia bacterium]|nr:UDP-N-acetylglucosamine 2-epimerase (non-hydrolyzing) [Rhodothermia bacterium]